MANAGEEPPGCRAACPRALDSCAAEPQRLHHGPVDGERRTDLQSVQQTGRIANPSYNQSGERSTTGNRPCKLLLTRAGHAVAFTAGLSSPTWAWASPVWHWP